MASTPENINTVTLSKSSYDSMRGTNDRANMLLSRLLGAIELDDDGNGTIKDIGRVLTTIDILYPETYKKKISALRVLRTKAFLKEGG